MQFINDLRNLVVELNYYYHAFLDNVYDLMHGIHTSKQMNLYELDINSKNTKYGNKYQACRVGVARKAIKLLGLDYSRLTLLDVGSGKGRVLHIALKLGFKKVIGVDFSKKLCDNAIANLKSFEDKCEIVASDIVDYKVPKDVSVFFLFNPFSVVIMRDIARKLRDQVRFHDEVFIVYVNPIAGKILSEFGFKLHRSRFSPNPNNIIHIYKCSK